MNCDRTEKISLMIDGELSQEETAVLQKHLHACADCRSAREDFLLLRREIGAYQFELDPQAQQQALRNIFASERATQSGSSTLNNQRLAAPFSSLRERLFGGLLHKPALLAGFALLLIGILAGLAFYLNLHRRAPDVAVSAPPPATNPSVSGATPRLQPSPSQVESVAVEQVNRERAAPSNNSVAVRDNPSIALRFSRRNERKRLPNVERNAVEQESGAPVIAVRQPASVDPLATEPSYLAASMTAPYVWTLDPAVSDATKQKTTRHVEQAQLLLRSFRNTRLAANGTADDIAYDKKRSQKLLYQNILLRREATKTGDVPVEKLLSSLEPILLDIANLPDRPARDDVRSIKERMQRKNIVAMLQINSTGATRSY